MVTPAMIVPILPIKENRPKNLFTSLFIVTALANIQNSDEMAIVPQISEMV